MTGTSHTQIGESTGVVNTGPGSVYVFQGAVFQGTVAETLQRLDPGGRDPRAVAGEQLRWLRRRFVPPTGYARARRLLRDRASVALSGPPGGGRRATALMLLHELAPDGGPVHEVDADDAEPGSLLDTGAVARRGRLLLDLSDRDAAQFLRVQAELTGFLAVVEERAARLVVVLPERAGGLVAAELRAHEARITPPSGPEVLMRHLRQDGIALTPDALTSQALTADAPDAAEVPGPVAVLADAPLARVADLAALVVQARHDAAGAGFAAWWVAALSRHDGDAEATALFLAGLPDGRCRALALTVAMLHGAPVEAVQRALTALVRRLRQPGDARARFDHADFTVELDRVGARVDSGRVRFRQQARETGVLRHFWAYYHDLRGDFQDWVRDRVRALDLAAEDRGRVVGRFADQVLRTGEPERLLVLAREWTGAGPSQRLVPDATQALTAGLEHPRHGRALRRLLLETVRERGLPEHFRLTLTLVCSRVMAVGHPDQAMVRLHHLARAEVGEPSSPAWAELSAQVMRERRLCARLLYRLTRHVPHGSPHADADRRLLLALADALSGQPEVCRVEAVREPLVRGWADALASLPHPVWGEGVRRWLSAAVRASPGLDDVLVTVLAEAGAASPRAVGRLYVVALAWANGVPEERPSRRPVAERLRRALDAAQGLLPSAPRAPRARQEPETHPTETPR